MSRTKVFVSYSHRDRDWLNRLREHLGLLERKRLVHVWSDTRITVGEDWQKEIEDALKESKVAILLISPAFLVSDYIWKEEMPRIMAHREQGMEVFPLIVRPCAWRIEEELKQLQARPVGRSALSTGSDAEVDLDLTTFVYELAERVEKLSGTLLVTEEREFAEQYRASADQQAVRASGSQRDSKRSGVEMNLAALTSLPERTLTLGQLPQSWTGHDPDYLRLRLIIRERQSNNFRGSIEYLDEETVMWVEGRVEENFHNIVADLGFESEGINSRAAQLAISFKETGYKTKGKRQLRFDGEYRALISGSSMSGAWFQRGGTLMTRFDLTRDDRPPAD